MATTIFVTLQQRKRKKKQTSYKTIIPPCPVVFVLGGPGAGKGTQCQLLSERLGWTHLSAGDLLRAERNKTSSSELGAKIQACMAAGQLVPSHLTCQLLEQAMQEEYDTNKATKFIIDGFPRSIENHKAWIDSPTASRHNVLFVLELVCPEEVLVGRLLERGKQSGRMDDTPQIITKRFQTHVKETAPILQTYQALNKVKTVLSDQPVEQVYKNVVACFEGL